MSSGSRAAAWLANTPRLDPRQWPQPRKISLACSHNRLGLSGVKRCGWSLHSAWNLLSPLTPCVPVSTRRLLFAESCHQDHREVPATSIISCPSHCDISDPGWLALCNRHLKSLLKIRGNPRRRGSYDPDGRGKKIHTTILHWRQNEIELESKSKIKAETEIEKDSVRKKQVWRDTAKTRGLRPKGGLCNCRYLPYRSSFWFTLPLGEIERTRPWFPEELGSYSASSPH